MRVTVIIPAYNAEKHLTEAVESVLEQTHSDFELIIIDDGSKDKTLQVAQAIAQKDQRIRVLTHANQGTAETLNRGLREAQTDWIFIMHADDVMLSNRLERQIAFIKENPDIKVCSCVAYYISEKGKQLGKTRTDLFTREKFNWHVQNNEAIGLLHPGIAFHRDTILSVNGYRQPFWPAEDIDLWNRVAEQGHLILVQNEPLMKYRIHTGSVSTAQFGATRLKYEWCRACMRARRSHKPEPSWEEFLASWNTAPLSIRLDRARKSSAKAYYHAAGHDCLLGNYLGGVAKLAIAALLQPAYVLPRLKQQVL